MKYFYLSVQILFTLCLMSCSSLERITEQDEVIIINKEKDQTITTKNLDKKKVAEQKKIPSTNKDKLENKNVIVEQKDILEELDNKIKEDEIGLVFDKTIKIGLLLPLSGDNEDLGKALSNSLEMALFETKSKNIRLIFRDSGDTIEKAIFAAKQLEEEGVSILIGPIFSSQALAIRKEINKEIPIFSFTNDENIKREGLWALGFSPEQQIKAIFNEMLSNSVKNIAIIVPNSTYGEKALQASRKQSTQNNIKINNIYFYDVLSNDFTDLGKILKKEKNKKYNGLLIIASGKQLKEIANIFNINLYVSIIFCTCNICSLYVHISIHTYIRILIYIFFNF